MSPISLRLFDIVKHHGERGVIYVDRLTCEHCMWAHCAKILVGLASTASRGKKLTFGNIVAFAVQSAHYSRSNTGDTLNHESIRNRINLLETRFGVFFYYFAICGEDELLCLGETAEISTTI